MIQFYQRNNGKYGEVVIGDLSKVQKMQGQYSLTTALKMAKADGCGEILTWTDKEALQKAGGQPVKHGWSDGGQCFRFEK